MRYQLIVVVLALCIISSGVKADLHQDLDGLCQKIKTCVVDQLDGVPDNMKVAYNAVIDGLCKSMAEPYLKTIGEHDLEKKAGACVQSINQLSCEKMQQQNETTLTSACQVFKEASEAKGVDFSDKSQ